MAIAVPPQAAPMLFAAPVIALVLLRNMRARRLRVEAMWIRPVILAAMGGLVLYQTPAGSLSPLAIAALSAAAAVGGAIGWFRGRTMRITVDPETHLARSQASPLAIALILGLFLLRFGARYFLADGAAALHINLAVATDALMLLLIGMVGVSQLEMWIRCRRLIAESKAAKAARISDAP